MNIKFFKEFGKFSIKKFYCSIGKVFEHVTICKQRIYDTNLAIHTPIGSFRITVSPKMS